MRRTQIYLTEEQDELLARRRKATGRTLSDLIRQAIDATYVKRRAQDRVQLIERARATVGAWASFSETGKQYVDRVRGSGRLARLHGVTQRARRS